MKQRTILRREHEHRHSAAARSLKLLIAAMRQYQAQLPSSERAAREFIGKSIKAAHPRWTVEHASPTACSSSVEWVSALFVVAAIANIEIYVEEMGTRVRRVRTLAVRHDKLSSVVGRAYSLFLTLGGKPLSKQPGLAAVRPEFVALEVFARIRHRIAHADGTAANSLTTILLDPTVARAWEHLSKQVTTGKRGVPALPKVHSNGYPSIPPDLAIYAGVVAKECVMRIDEQFHVNLSEREILTIAIDELKRLKQSKSDFPKHFESWIRSVLVGHFALNKYADPSMCVDGALARELRRLKIWNQIPGSSKQKARMALQ